MTRLAAKYNMPFIWMICLTGRVYLWMVLAETKAKTLEDIQRELVD